MNLKQKAWILATALTFAAVPILASAQDAATDNTAEKAIQLVAARASLSKGIDAKKAKQGDAVTAKLDEAVKVPGSVELPRNTVLLGHIDQVQPSENKGDSSVQLTFDKAQLKDGQQLAIKATIMHIEPPASMMRNQDNAVSASPMPGETTPPAGGNSGSSGGSSSGSMRPSSPSPAPMPSMSSGSPEQSPSTQPGIPGIQLHSDIHESNSGVLTARKKNVHLDGGTEMQFAIAVIPAGTQIK